MAKFPVILDIETKYTFRNFQDPKKLGVSVAVIYNYKNQESEVFFEKDLPRLFPVLESASYVIGYNVKDFDLPVLQGYYPGKVNQLSVFDILEDIKEKIGRRLALNDLIYATLGKKKSGHGLQAINYFKNQEWEKLKKYCLDDVMLTKELFDFGTNKGEIYYLSERGKETIKVDWKKYLISDNSNDISLTLPF